MPTVELAAGREELINLGPTLLVRIGFDRSFSHEQSPAPRLPRELHPALIDTGADLSSIDSALAQRLELPLVGECIVAGAHGEHALPQYLAQIYVPDFNYTIYGFFAGSRLTAGGQHQVAILGRLFLSDFTMTYEGQTGITRISND